MTPPHPACSAKKISAQKLVFVQKKTLLIWNLRYRFVGANSISFCCIFVAQLAHFFYDTPCMAAILSVSPGGGPSDTGQDSAGGGAYLHARARHKCVETPACGPAATWTRSACGIARGRAGWGSRTAGYRCQVSAVSSGLRGPG